MKSEKGESSSSCGMDLQRLPDEVLSRILSSLGTEESVRTSVLSKRWRYLYTDIPHVVISLRRADSVGFMGIVDELVINRRNRSMETFKLVVPCAFDPLRLQGWVQTVLSHHITKLELILDHFDTSDLLLPPELWTCNSLLVLKLVVSRSDASHGVDALVLPDHVSLPSLNFLQLSNAKFAGDDSLDRLLSSCPVLEDFIFRFDRGLYSVVVSSPTLRRLTLHTYGNGLDTDGLVNDGCKIVVDAPSLVYLEYTIFDAKSHEFVNIESLEKASIDFALLEGDQYDYFRSVHDVMIGIRDVQTLRISDRTLLSLKGCDIPIQSFFKMTHLTIYSCNLGLNALPYLLEECVSAKTLVLELEGNCLWVPDAWNGIDESKFRCFSFAVKTIEVYEFSGGQNLVEMVRYLLKFAKVLKLMKVHLSSSCENKAGIAEELQMLPSASEACNVDVVF